MNTDIVDGIHISYNTVYYCVYILYQDVEPVYVGITNDIKLRLKSHRHDKIFNKYLLLDDGLTKENTNLVESSLINYMKFQYPNICLNKVGFKRSLKLIAV